MNAIPKPVLAALNHVREHFPNVVLVVFNSAGRWQYMDEYYEAPKFEGKINVSILEDAGDSVETLPAVFEHPDAQFD